MVICLHFCSKCLCAVPSADGKPHRATFAELAEQRTKAERCNKTPTFRPPPHTPSSSQYSFLHKNHKIGNNLLTTTHQPMSTAYYDIAAPCRQRDATAENNTGVTTQGSAQSKHPEHAWVHTPAVCLATLQPTTAAKPAHGPPHFPLLQN